MTTRPMIGSAPTADRRRRRLARSAHRAGLLDQVVANEPKRARRPPWAQGRRAAVGLVVSTILVTSTYVSIDTWLTNQQVKQQFAAQAAASTESTATNQPTSKPKEASATKSSPIGHYEVAADRPRAIYIDKLGVQARILPMGVDAEGKLDVPTNLQDVGWYTGSKLPGVTGAMLIDGHSGLNVPGVFGTLDLLEVGDRIQVERGDHTRITYEVAAKEIVARTKVDMHQMMRPYGDATEGLNLISCIGQWDEAASTSRDRVLVFATRTS